VTQSWVSFRGRNLAVSQVVFRCVLLPPSAAAILQCRRLFCAGFVEACRASVPCILDAVAPRRWRQTHEILHALRHATPAILVRGQRVAICTFAVYSPSCSGLYICGQITFGMSSTTIQGTLVLYICARITFCTPARLYCCYYTAKLLLLLLLRLRLRLQLLRQLLLLQMLILLLHLRLLLVLLLVLLLLLLLLGLPLERHNPYYYSYYC